MQILCESVFCQLLATFEVPKDHTSLVSALYSHLKSKHHLQTAVGYDPCFHLGSLEDIAHRTNCRFCSIVNSALAIGSHVAESDDIHVQCIIEEGKFDLVTLAKSGRPEGRVLALGVRIVFCEGPDKAQATIDWGRPINFRRFDLEQVRQWLSLCEQSHQAPCQRNPAKPRGGMRAPQSHTFRLIDVRKECIVSRPWQSRYLALSYVWGGIEQLRLEKHSIDTLKVPQSLQKLRDDIPKTIQDAITFVYLIGEKYLWVDVLCLVQDDQNSMRDGIQLMNFVYENALATIVAADGSDPHAGLRRLHSNSSYPLTTCVQTMKPGLRLMALGALGVHLKKSKWSSRSWTYGHTWFKDPMSSHANIIQLPGTTFIKAYNSLRQQAGIFLLPPAHLVRRYMHGQVPRRPIDVRVASQCYIVPRSRLFKQWRSRRRRGTSPSLDQHAGILRHAKAYI